MRKKTLWEKEKFLVSNNFSFFQRVFKRPVLRTRKNQSLYGKELAINVSICTSENYTGFLGMSVKLIVLDTSTGHGCLQHYKLS